MRRTVFFISGLLMLTAAHAASFDCAKAASRVEKLICSDPQLSQRDEEMNAAYRAALADEQHRDEVRRQQRAWLSQLGRCADAACIMRAYDTRLAVLKGAHGSIGATYATVEQYVMQMTGGDLKRYICNVTSDDPPCGARRRGDTSKPARVFGMLISESDASGFIFVLKRKDDGQFQLEATSSTFEAPQHRGGGIGVEEFAADGDDRFHVQFSSGGWGSPTSDVYSFQLVRAQWRVGSHSSWYTMECTDEIGVGGASFQDYLAGEVTITTYDDCKHPKRKKSKDATPAPLLTDFAP